jgi:hypothetical protein
MTRRRVGNRGHCSGTAAIYAAASDFWTHSHGDYEIDLWENSFPKEMRAYRKRAKKRGTNSALRDEALKNEVVVLFGPNINAEKAMNLLRRLANQIGKRGLYTGQSKLGQATFERKVNQI